MGGKKKHVCSTTGKRKCFGDRVQHIHYTQPLHQCNYFSLRKMSYVTNSSLARGLRPHRCSDSKAVKFSTPKRSMEVPFLYHTYSPISFCSSPCPLSPVRGNSSSCFLKQLIQLWKTKKVCPCSRQQTFSWFLLLLLSNFHPVLEPNFQNMSFKQTLASQKNT